MRRALALAAATLSLLAARAGFPCGASFGGNIAVDPQQDIIVTWKDGVETYAFQPIFCGTASEFGLVLPVPAPLAQQPTLGDQQTFTTVANLAAPKKVQIEAGHSFGCLAGGGSESAPGGMNNTDDTTTVVASGRVGFLDWVQIQSDTTAALTTWLSNSGYQYSPAASSAFEHYVSKGWYFIAFKISHEATPDGGTVCKALGPIALSFPSTAAVVPTRMATAGSTMATSSSQQFAWRIFGITRGNEQLGALGRSDYTFGYSGAIGAGDVPALGGLAEAGDRLTRLYIRFGYGSSDDDLVLGTATPSDYRDVEYVTVYDDAACALGQSSRPMHGCLLVLSGFALAGTILWRRRRARGDRR